MSEKSRVSARVDDDVKRDAEQVFDQMGLSTSAAVSIFLNQVVREQGLPFQPHLVPNEATHEAMQRTRQGETNVYDDEEDMFEDLEMQ